MSANAKREAHGLEKDVGKRLEKRVGRAFRKSDLLARALTHSSTGEVNNERLEFLGDRVLGLIVAERLFRDYPDEGESGLAPRLNALVSKAACARAARRAGLGEALILSRSEQEGGGRDKDTILADACEAVLAALYLDGGLKAARDFIETYWQAEFADVVRAPRDAKTVLQEWAAATRRGQPAYKVLARSGPDHAPLFEVEVAVAGAASARGTGGSKRCAERAAALALLKAAGVDV